MSASNPTPRKRLPVKPSQENLRKQAKRRAKSDNIPLAEAQHLTAREYGAKNWAELMHIVETMLRGADQLQYVKYEMEALPKAANSNDIQRVREILASGEFTQHDLDLALARSVLAFDQRGELARLLLAHGADPDGQYGSDYGPIIFVTGECLDVEGLRFLIEAGADVTFPSIDTKYGPHCPLSYWLGAYSRGKNDAKHAGIEILLKHGAYIPPEFTPEILAIHRGDTKLLGELIDADRSLLRKTYPDMPYGNISLAGATLLHCAVEFGEIECIETILSRSRDWGDLNINTPAAVIDGIGGQTPIFHAINTNCDKNFYTLEYLLKNMGTKIDMGVKATFHLHGQPQTPAMTPLEYALKAEREIDPKWAHFRPRVKEEIALLQPLDRMAIIQGHCARGEVDAVAAMLDANPELLGPQLWPPAYKAKSVELTRLLLDRGLDPNISSAPRRAIDLAGYHALPEIVDLLIARGADVVSRNKLGETPMDLLEAYEPRPIGDVAADRVRKSLIRAGGEYDLHAAIRGGDLETVKSMLDASPELIESPVPWPPLFTAARAGRVEMVKFLLARGARVESSNDMRNTPLWFACQSPADAADRIQVAKILLDKGANPRRECEDQSTPLHFAAWRGPREMVELLIRHNAKTWQTDKDNQLPIDYARRGPAADKEAIVHLLDRPVIDDPHFRKAVDAIHAGDLSTLKKLLAEHPNLNRDRAVEPDCYLPTDYFGSPKLLWFVANNPTLIPTMPANIDALATAIIDAGVDQADLDYTLGLVMTSDTCVQQHHLEPLMSLLIARGAVATPDSIHGTLGHQMLAPVQILLDRGMTMTASIAAAMGDADALNSLLKTADPKTVQDALSMAVINRQVECARICLDAGADVNGFLIVHVHSTPSHQAAVNDDAEMLRLLVGRGADLTIEDKLWRGTPLGWAIHTQKSAAEAFLRSLSTQQ